ncbi:hypothetical protein BCR41DRAFT_385111, partial [Lobosporangium transversale]
MGLNLGADTSYLVATIYLTFLFTVAVMMSLRARTRLRAFACFLTYVGLTIAIIGLLRAKAYLSPGWYWAWNFLGEGLAVVALTLTIVSVGSGFYPMAGKRNLYWRLSMILISIYGFLSLVNVALYVNEKLYPRLIDGPAVLQLRKDIVNVGFQSVTALAYELKKTQTMNLIPKFDTGLYGAQDWRQLCWSEREMFSRPEVAFYLAHQYLMIATCLWSCMYLFVPLVMHHRHGPIGRPVDSDMMAVGVWYLSCIMLLAIVYTSLNIMYIAKPEYIFQQQMQALDLCVRITIGPIFFLPAPGFLLRFYREHFKKFRSHNSNSARNGGGTGRNMGSGNQDNGSFTNDSNALASFPQPSISLDDTRIGSSRTDGSATRCSFDMSPDKTTSTQHKLQDPTSPKSIYNPMKIFQSRERGTSVESSRVLNKDFECGSSSQSQYEDRSESFHLPYYSSSSHNTDTVNLALMDSSRHCPTSTLDSYNSNVNESEKSKKTYCDQSQVKSSVILEAPQTSQTLQTLQPILTEEHLRTAASRNGAFATSSRPDMEYTQNGSKSHQEYNNMFARDLESKDNTTKSEQIGEHGSQGSKNMSSSDCTKDKLNKMSSDNNDGVSVSDSIPSLDTPIEQLTGLQRQLAEHRSALLPKVLAYQAYHEDRATAEPFDRTFQLPSVNPYCLDSPRPSINEARTLSDLPTRLSSDGLSKVDKNALSSTSLSPSSTATGGFTSRLGLGIDLEAKSPSHIIDPSLWSTPPVSARSNFSSEIDNSYNITSTGSGSNSSHSNNKHRDSKSVDGFKAVFKAFNGGDRSGNSKSSQAAHDHKDRSGSYHNRRTDGPPDPSQSPIAATVEELAQLSVVKKRDDEIQRGPLALDYTDPYDHRPGKRTQGRGPGYNTITSENAKSSSTVSKPSSTPSLGSSKSRDSLSKHSGSSYFSYKDKDKEKEGSSRPTSPGSKKPSSKQSAAAGSISSRASRSKSDLPVYREGVETSPRTPAFDVPFLFNSLSDVSSAESPVSPPAIQRALCVISRKPVAVPKHYKELNNTLRTT